MKSQLVSIIIPTYKRSDFLIRAIESALSQTYDSIEVIVVDDNGIGTEFQKQTENRLYDYISTNKIVYLKHEINKNGSAARNTGWKYAKGDFLKFLDDDDILLKDCIERQVESLQSTDEVYGASYCGHDCFTKIGEFENIVQHPATISGDIHYELFFNTISFNTSTLLFKRECIVALNGFDETYKRHQDLELLTRYFSQYKIIATSGILLRMDMSDRQNCPKPDLDYEMKKKFLNQFENLLSKWGIKEQYSHHLWATCLSNAVACNNFHIAKLSVQELGGVRKLQKSEHILVLKQVLYKSSLIRKIKALVSNSKK